MKIILIFVLILLASLSIFAFGGAVNYSAAQTRCGWFVNPTPGNAWLIDAAAEWTIAVQGGFQADGDWPEFSESRWVETNGSYGYGCACMKVDSNARSKRITRIYSANSRPLSACRNDRAIRDKEPGE